MAWDEIKFENIKNKEEIYKLSLLDTNFNLLFQIYWFENEDAYDNERVGYRVFFGVNYWPPIRQVLTLISPTDNESYITWGNKRIKIELIQNTIFFSRQASDRSGANWRTEVDDTRRRDGTERSIQFPRKLIKQIILIFDSLMETSIYFRVRTSDWDPFYPDQMINHDQSMIALKIFLEKDKDFQMFTKAGIDPGEKEKCINKIKYFEDDLKKPFEKREYKKIDPYHQAMITQWKTKLKRAEFSELVNREQIDRVYFDNRGDDGYIELTLSNEKYKINFDWEIRNDWVKNYLNVPIYFNRRNYVKEKPSYCAIENIAYAPTIPEKAYKETIEEVEDLISNLGGGSELYFIYNSMGQFERKINKQAIMLSIQCSRIAPFWPKLENIPEGGYFIVAWHEDFGEPTKVIRTAGTSGQKEKNAGICETKNFGLFKFSEEGIKRFGKILKNQYNSGIITDSNGNIIPRDRKWS